MRASLPMYDLPALRAAHGRFWRLLRGRLVDVGIDAPVALTPDGIGPAFWTAPDLVFSQTCGMPYRTQLLGKVQLVGTPDYGLPGCPPGYYASHLIKRQKDSRQTLADFAGATAALNDTGSQSGFAALVTAMTAAGITFGNAFVTGAHAASVEAVANGTADIAAIDAVTWQLLSTHTETCAGVETFAQTDPTPGLPYICSLSVDPQQVHTATAEAIDALPQADKDLLMLKGLVAIPADHYTAVPSPDPAVLGL